MREHCCTMPSRGPASKNLMAGLGRGPPSEKLTGRAGPGRGGPASKNLMAGPGRGPSSEKLKGRAGPRPIISKSDGPGRAVAHEMWASTWAAPPGP